MIQSQKNLFLIHFNLKVHNPIIITLLRLYHLPFLLNLYLLTFYPVLCNRKSIMTSTAFEIKATLTFAHLP